MPAENAILNADSSFFDALVHADVDELGELLAEDFRIVDVQSGGVVGREEFMNAVAGGYVRFDRIDRFPSESLVREYVATAIVIGRTVMGLVMPDGSTFTGGSRYTHVFVHSDGRWRLASAQGTAIPGG